MPLASSTQTRKPTIGEQALGARGSRPVGGRHRGDPLDQALVPAHAVEEGVDPEVLVVGMDRLALRLGHPERCEPVDPVADLGEEPRVGGRHHDVRRGHGVGKHLGDRGLDQRERLVVDTARSGSARCCSTTSIWTWSSSTVLRTCSSTPATVSPTMIRMLTPALAVRGDHVERGRAGERGDRERRARHRRRLRAGGDQRAGEHRPEPGGVGHQRSQRARGVRRHPAQQLDGRVGDARGHR